MRKTDDVTKLIEIFLNAKRGEEIERIADGFSDPTDMRPVLALMYRLGDSIVREDPDVEDAVCSALVRRGIMECRGNQTFQFRSREVLPAEALDALTKYAGYIPNKYFSS